MRRFFLSLLMLPLISFAEAGFRIGGTTCLDVSSDRIYHDTDCDGTKDSGEEFIDQIGGSGGASSLQVKEDDVEVSSPTASIDFLGDHFNVTESPSFEVNVELSSTPIWSQETLQSGATFYVSSGTVENQFFVKTDFGIFKLIPQASGFGDGQFTYTSLGNDQFNFTVEDNAGNSTNLFADPDGTSSLWEFTATSAPNQVMTVGPGYHVFTSTASSNFTIGTYQQGIITIINKGSESPGKIYLNLEDHDNGSFFQVTQDTTTINHFLSGSTIAVSGQFRDTSLLSQDCVGTDGSGNFIAGTCTGGSGTPLIVSDDGSQIDTDVSTMNFTYGILSTQTASGHVAVYVDSTTLASDIGSGSPGGSDTHVQYNNGGSFGGESNFTYDDTLKEVNINATTGGAGEINPLDVDASAASRSVAIDVTASGAVYNYALWAQAGEIHLSDGEKLRMGGTSKGGEDAEIYYDGTDLIIDPDVVGSGVVSVSGGLSAAGAVDFGGATSLEMPQSTAPTLDAIGEFALDTSVTNHQATAVYSTATANGEMYVIAVSSAEYHGVADNDVVKYDAATDTFMLEADATSAGGGDDFGSHTATEPVNMAGFPILNVASMTMISGQAPVISSTWSTLTVQVTDTSDDDFVVKENSVLIPSGAGVTGLTEDGDLRISTNAYTTTGSSGTLTFYSNGTTYYVVATTAPPADNQIAKYDAALNQWSVEADAGGSGSPGGSDTELQFNNASSFDGVAMATYNATTNELTISSKTSFVNVSTVTFFEGSTVAVQGMLQMDDAVNMNDLDGAGLTVSASSLGVGAGTAITVNANDVAVTANGIGPTQIDETASYAWTGTMDMGGATVEIENGTGVTCTGVGEICQDTTDNVLVMNGKVVGHAVEQFTVTLSTWFNSSDWNGDRFPIWQAPQEFAVTITSITATTYGTAASTVTFNLEEVAFGTTLGTAGTNVFTVSEATANVTGRLYTSSDFSNASIATGAYLMWDTDQAAQGTTPYSVTLTVYYTKDQE